MADLLVTLLLTLLLLLLVVEFSPLVRFRFRKPVFKLFACTLVDLSLLLESGAGLVAGGVAVVGD